MVVRIVFALVASLGVSPAAFGAFADFLFVPPSKASGAALEAHLHPMPQAMVADYLAEEYPIHRFTDYAGQNAALQRDPARRPTEVAAGIAAGLEGRALFPAAIPDGSQQAWLAGVTSADAYALRLRMNLAGLGPGTELWLLDPAGSRAFGPYTAADARPGGTWLATVQGGTAVLLVRSSAPQPPAIALQQVSHFYRDVFAREPGGKQLGVCPIPIACESNATLQQVSTGVGLMFVGLSGGGQAQCSGALLNNADTIAREPFFLTANHCFIGGAGAGSVEVVWDFRADTCDGQGIPNQGALPRSRGARTIATAPNLDVELLRLDEVPIGAFGRAWLGWDTRFPNLNSGVLGLHYPRGTTMKVSRGRVTNSSRNFTINFPPPRQLREQVRINWDEGITEFGSSGSPAMFENINFRVFGVLSNGNRQRCNGAGVPPSDNYGSLRAFFPQVQPFLTAGGSVEGEPGGGDGGPGGGNSPPGPSALAGLLDTEFATVDLNGDGRVDFDEAVHRLPELTQDAFGQVDLDDDGGITPEEVEMAGPFGGCNCTSAKEALLDPGQFLGDFFLFALVLFGLVAYRPGGGTRATGRR